MLNFLTKDFKNGKDFALLILRLVFGLVLLYGHGFEKLTTIFSGEEIRFMDPIGIGEGLSFYLSAFAEGICAILLVAGFFTRFAALVLVLNFLVILRFHLGLGDSIVILEPRFFYFFGFMALFFSGAGKFSLDYFLFNQKK